MDRSQLMKAQWEKNRVGMMAGMCSKHPSSIRQLRLDLEMSQVEFALKLKITGKGGLEVSRMETGYKRPPRLWLYRMHHLAMVRGLKWRFARDGSKVLLAGGTWKYWCNRDGIPLLERRGVADPESPWIAGGPMNPDGEVIFWK